MKLTTLEPNESCADGVICLHTHCCDCGSMENRTEIDFRHRHPDVCETIAREQNWSRESCQICATYERELRSRFTITLIDGLGGIVWSGEFTATTDGSEFHGLERLQIEAAECLHQNVKAIRTAGDIIHAKENNPGD